MLSYSNIALLTTRRAIRSHYRSVDGETKDPGRDCPRHVSLLRLFSWSAGHGYRTHKHSKYTSPYVDTKAGKFKGIQVNYTGNHKKSLKHSIESSLLKLRTDYIDLLYVHWWDYSTPIEEVMQSLNELVRNGKVLYLGVSDTPGEASLRLGRSGFAYTLSLDRGPGQRVRSIPRPRSIRRLVSKPYQNVETI